MEIKVVINDRVIGFVRRIACRRTFAFIALLSVAVPVALYASDLDVFKAGDPISATAVNDNFGNLDKRVGAFESVLSMDDGGNLGVGAEQPEADLNIQGNLSQPLTGQVGMVSGNPTLTGSGTLFTEELSPGDAILVGEEVFTVVNIVSDTQLELDAPPVSGPSNVTAYTDSDLFVVQGGDGVDRFIVDKSGNVGIGTTDPKAMLHIASPDSPIAGSSLALEFGEAGLAAFGFRTYYNSGADNNTLVLDRKRGSWQSDAAMAWRADGNVGIGTTSPGQKLDVYGPAGSPATSGSTQHGIVRVEGSGGDGLDIGVLAGSPYTTWMQSGFKGDLSIDYPIGLNPNGGNVGIGTNSPAYKLDVAGQIHADNVAFSSDERLKADISPVADALEGIQCLQGVTYRWVDPSRTQDLQLGLVAQEVERCFPEVVSTDQSGYKSVAYARLVAPIIEAVKEQQWMIEGQQETIDRQQRAIGEQRSIILEQRDSLARLRTRVDSQQQELIAQRTMLEELAEGMERLRQETH